MIYEGIRMESQDLDWISQELKAKARIWLTYRNPRNIPRIDFRVGSKIYNSLPQ